MTILKNVEIWFAKLSKPNAKFNKENPTWELQIRTTSKEIKKEWEEMCLPVKAILPDEGEPYWRVNLKKKSIKNDGGAASPVNVVDAKLEPFANPNTIGNGSVGNIRLFQYEYPKAGTSQKGVATVLMGVQVLKHVVFTPKTSEDFEEQGETQVVGATGEDFEEAAF